MFKKSIKIFLLIVLFFGLFVIFSKAGTDESFSTQSGNSSSTAFSSADSCSITNHTLVLLPHDAAISRPNGTITGITALRKSNTNISRTIFSVFLYLLSAVLSAISEYSLFTILLICLTFLLYLIVQIQTLHHMDGKKRMLPC